MKNIPKKATAMMMAFVTLLTLVTTGAYSPIFVLGSSECTVHPEGHTSGQSAAECSDRGTYALYDEQGDITAYMRVFQDKWQSFYPDLDSGANFVLEQMLQRTSDITLYVATTDSKYSDDALSVFDYISDYVYSGEYSMSLPDGGDYLLSQCKKQLNITGYYPATAENGISYYVFYLNCEYHSTYSQEQTVKNALAQWNETFIVNNEYLESKDNSVREYYIVKTIYDFLVRNTKYDVDSYNKYIDSGETVSFAHTAYAALFGNIEGCENASSFRYQSDYDWGTYYDGEIIKISAQRQGMSVCEGYTAVFYYLCKLNGIENRIVNGRITNYSDIYNKYFTDGHAWNYVKLDDSGGYDWYQVDATYAATNSVSLLDRVNYYFFLRGRESIYFSTDYNHQVVYENRGYPVLSKEDYAFPLADLSNYANSQSIENYVIIVRKSTAGSAVFEEYILVSPDNEYYTYNEDTQTYEKTDGFTYKGTGNVFYMLIPGLIDCVEYSDGITSADDAGTYTMTATGSNHSSLVRNFSIVPLDMTEDGDISSDNYYIAKTDFNFEMQFSGKNQSVAAEIYDRYDHKLSEGDEYTISYLDSKGNTCTPKSIGKYTLLINYKGNYTGTFRHSLEITKADLSTFQK